MSLPKATTVGIAGMLVCSIAVLPAFAGPKPKPKPKPITGTYQASATPDPTPFVGDPCVPTIPSAMHTKEFTIPAKGTLVVDLMNTLDWATKLRSADGDTLTFADAGTPEVRESISFSFKKKQKIFIDTCNFAGEPAISVNFKFTYT